jgi:hypothetical protein
MIARRSWADLRLGQTRCSTKQKLGNLGTADLDPDSGSIFRAYREDSSALNTPGSSLERGMRSDAVVEMLQHEPTAMTQNQYELQVGYGRAGLLPVNLYIDVKINDACYPPSGTEAPTICDS